LTINRHTNHITIEIYRKPTSSDTTIHYTSNHPMEHKIAANRCLIKKNQRPALTDTSKEQELNDVTIEANNNGFPTQVI